MIHRSFKPAKCKTSLKLAASRIKLLKNKREAQVKQLKREVAELLESGKDRTARIRVEHVLREENTVTAYELIEIYCELIVARLPMIDSQKNCPIDLKEAIASVIYASPRCADIPELGDARKHFVAKYGKEFTTAAAELRPDCGVSRMLIEKLTAKAPDGQTKLKLLAKIADEHNVKWDPESSGEGDFKPHDDLLNGPNSFESNKLHVEPPNVQVPPNQYIKVPSGLHVPANRVERNDGPGMVHDPYARPSFHSQNLASTHLGSNMASVSRPHEGTSGSRTGGVHHRHSDSEERNHFLGGQSWNMEFKDATEAAQAAAESAERASMAARAAAEFSSGERFTRQKPMESQKSFAYGSRNEGPQRYASSKLEGEDIAKDPVNNFSQAGNRGLQTNQHEENEQNNFSGLGRSYDGRAVEASQSTSFKSNISSVDNQFEYIPPGVDMHSRMNSYVRENNDFTGEVSINQQSGNSMLEYVSQDHGSAKSKKTDYGEARISKQSSRASFSSHSSTVRDEYDTLNSVQHEVEIDAVENPFSIVNERNTQIDTSTSIHDNTAVTFDESASDDDGFDVDGGYKDQRSNMQFPSNPGRESFTHISSSTNMPDLLETSQSHFPIQSTQPNSDAVFSKSSKSLEVPMKEDEFLHVKFDDSDDPLSESEEELNKAQLAGNNDTRSLPDKDNISLRDSELTHKSFSFAEKGNAGLNKQPSSQPCLYDSEPNEGLHDSNLGSQDSTADENFFVYGGTTGSDLTPHDHPSQQYSRLSLGRQDTNNAQMPELDYARKDVDLVQECSLESGKEINFGMLTGGFRNKGYRRPPGGASSVKQTAEDASVKMESSSFGAPTEEQNNKKASTEINKKPSARSSFTYFDDDEMEEKLPYQSIRSGHETFNRTTSSEVNEKSSSRIPITYSDSKSSNYAKDGPKQYPVSIQSPGGGVSRRTKAPGLNSDSSYKKTAFSSELSLNSGYNGERNFPTSSARASDTQPKALRPVEHTYRSGSSSEKPESVEKVGYKPESKKYSSQKSLTSSSSLDSPSTNNASKQASHVHPKLPDYEALTAHFNSLRQNR